jgi:hypothetical protein
MKAAVTSSVKELSRKITSTAKDYKEKTERIWHHVRSIPYELFSITSSDIDETIKQKGLTCYGKALLQASLLESEGIPWRFEISKCPATHVGETIQVLGEKNPVISKLYEKFRGMIGGNELIHTSVQVNVDGSWKLMDTTLDPEICGKIKDPAKRDRCFSTDNVTAVHGCRIIGHEKELPEAIIKSLNAVSSIGNMANNLFFWKKR